MDDLEYDYLFKIVIVGDASVGKSNILTRFIRDEFMSNSRSTIGVEFATKNITIKNRVIKAQIWDTAGQEKFRALSKTYYRGAVGCLVVYDITSSESFSHVEKWLSEVKDTADEKLVAMLIGNKVDLEDKRAVNDQEAAEFAEKHGLGFMETSAKDNLNIEAAFNKLINEIYCTLSEEDKTDNVNTRETENEKPKRPDNPNTIVGDNIILTPTTTDPGIKPKPNCVC